MCRREAKFADAMRPKLLPHSIAQRGAGLDAEEGP